MASTQLTYETVSTVYGDLAVTKAGSGGPPVLLIHGNSFSSKVFKHIFASSLPQKTQVIAFDLPGHGDSGNALNPEEAYTQPGFAKAAVDLLQHYQLKSVIVFGWSLGGHVGIEMIPLCEAAGIDFRGLMITGTPAIPKAKVILGFYTDDHTAAAFREKMTAEEQDGFAKVATGDPYEPWMKDDVVRAHGVFRPIMFMAAHEGRQSDQQALMEESEKPLVAVINGKEEPFIKLDFVKSVKYKNLWKGECIDMPGLHHAPMWEDPDGFQKYLDEFAKDCGVS